MPLPNALPIVSKLAWIAITLAFATLLSDVASAQSSFHGNFRVDRRIDPINDSNTSILSTVSRTGGDLSLSVVCSPFGPMVVLHHEVIFSLDTPFQVTYRFDDSAASGPWPASRLGQEFEWSLLFGRNPPQHEEFISRAKSADQIAIRLFNPEHGQTITSTASLEGFTTGMSATGCDISAQIQAYTPERGNPVRSEVVEALRTSAQDVPGLGPQTIFIIQALSVLGDWALIKADPQNRDGSPTSIYDSYLGEDPCDHEITALIGRDSSGWRVSERAVGPCDSNIDVWLSQHGVSERIMDRFVWLGN